MGIENIPKVTMHLDLDHTSKCMENTCIPNMTTCHCHVSPNISRWQKMHLDLHLDDTGLKYG